MLVIRLQRLGKKKKPSYRLVVSEKTRDTQAKSLELLGHYSPTQDPKLLDVKADRIKHFIGLGAQCSPTVHNILVKEGVIEGDKKKSVSISNKRQTKLDAKKEADAEAQKAAEEKKKEEAEAAKAAAEEAKAKAEAEKAAAEAAPAEEVTAEEPKAEETPADSETPEASAEAQEPKEESKTEEKSAE